MTKKVTLKKRKPKYLTAQEAAQIYGVNAKTLLNRSGLSKSDPRYIPSLKMRGGRRKYFEQKMLDRLFIVGGHV
jgi:hypothetical protein